MNVAISAIRTKSTKLGRYELIESIQSLDHKVYYIGQDSEDEPHPDFLKYNVGFLSIPLKRVNTNPLIELKTIVETKRVLSENNISYLIVYGIRTFPTVVLAAKLAGVKRVLCIVNGSGRLFQLKGIKGFVVKLMSYPMLWLAFFLADRILFQNSDDMSMIKRKGLLWRRNYGIVNGSGVNLEDFRFSKLAEKSVFLMISRLTGSKGVNEYIRAANIVKQYYPEAVFNLVGPMDDDDSSIDIVELQKAIDKGIINLKGRAEDVRSHINDCRVFVLPSYYPEGVPRATLEAMATGRPIITTDSPGCRETVIDGINGFLVSPKDAAALADKMIYMIKNPNVAEQMAKASRKIAVEKFDIHQINNHILSLISCS